MKKFNLVPPRNVNIDSGSRIEKVDMDELLASEVTKKSLTEYLIKKVIEHLKLQNIDFIVAGNGQTFSSLSVQIVVDNNNHVLLSHFLRTPPSRYILQTPIFVILLNHSYF